MTPPRLVHFLFFNPTTLGANSFVSGLNLTGFGCITCLNLIQLTIIGSHIFVHVERCLTKHDCKKHKMKSRQRSELETK